VLVVEKVIEGVRKRAEAHVHDPRAPDNGRQQRRDETLRQILRILRPMAAPPGI
jgi:hypothetical protein